jgi:hypothetical protein
MIATSSTQPKPHAMPVPPRVCALHAETNGALNSRNKIGEIGDPCGIPVGVGKLSERYPGSLMRVLLLQRNDARLNSRRMWKCPKTASTESGWGFQ